MIFFFFFFLYSTLCSYEFLYCCYEDKPVPLIIPDNPGGTSSDHSMQSRRPAKTYKSENDKVTALLVHHQRVWGTLPGHIAVGQQLVNKCPLLARFFYFGFSFAILLFHQPFSSTRRTVCQVSKVKVKGLSLNNSCLA